MEYSINRNAQYNSVEITFPGKPSEAVRDALKALKYRWHSVRRVWYGYTTEEAARAAIDEAEAPLIIQEEKFIDGGGLYDGFEGGHYRKWNTDQELKALVLADCKKAGIKASIRFGRGGYDTSLYMTITLPAEAVKPFDEWAQGYDFSGRFLHYIDGEGRSREIYRAEYLAMPDAEREAMENSIRRGEYAFLLDHIKYDQVAPSDGYSILTDAGNKVLLTAKAIVDSYNRDCSNSQVDYFDRAIYDHYAIKII